MTHVELLPDGETRLLDRYQVIGTISRGGMGTVSLARIGGVGGFQRFVAIKQLHPHLAQEQEFVEMFLDEARLAAGIHHQNVVSILEIGSSDAGLYLVMEYIEGGSLARIASRACSAGKPLTRPVSFRIVLDALAGLHAAHELTDEQGAPLGLVHRDCSPQNILLGVDGAAKITDFGVARASSRLATTREGSFKGKLAYMAPEQTQGDELDRRADLFSMGIVLWELLTERRLFRAKSDAQTLNRLLHEPIPRLRDVLAEVHPALDALVAKALQRDPDERFQSAEEMAHALEQVARAAALPGEPYAIALPRAVGQFVTGVLGDELTSERESVRSWLTKVGSGPVSPMGSVPAARRLELIPRGRDSMPHAAVSSEPIQTPSASHRASPPRPRAGEQPSGGPGDESTLPRTVRSLEVRRGARRSPWAVLATLLLLGVGGAVLVRALADWAGEGAVAGPDGGVQPGAPPSRDLGAPAPTAPDGASVRVEPGMGGRAPSSAAGGVGAVAQPGSASGTVDAGGAIAARPSRNATLREPRSPPPGREPEVAPSASATAGTPWPPAAGMSAEPMSNPYR